MRLLFMLAAATLLAAADVRAQDPAPRDTTESAAEIERRLTEELGRADTMAPPAPAPARSLNPDISAIGDFLVDLSPDEATLEGGDRFQLREVELGIQGAVDPYFRYDIFIGAHEDEVEVEEAYATTLGLPAGLQVKLGKFHLPFGKVNLTHRPELHTIDYPLVVQEYFGEEGFTSTGVWASLIGAPLGFFQEISLAATNGAEAPGHGVEAAEEPEPADAEEAADVKENSNLFEDLADRLWVAHLKNSVDVTEAANLELGGSVATAEDEGSRTTHYGLDATWRWKPPQLSKYRSAILQAEVAWRAPEHGGTQRGAFVFGQWQLSRRTHVGARWDYVELPEEEELAGEPASVRAGQVLLRVFPTEFSQLRLAYERQSPKDGDALDRLLFQAVFALGPHRPHPY